MIDSVLSQPSRPLHLGQQARWVKLVADPAECFHFPVQLILVLLAVPPGPFGLIQGFKCLAPQVGYAGGVEDCPLFPAGSGLFLQFLQNLLSRPQHCGLSLLHLLQHAVDCVRVLAPGISLSGGHLLCTCNPRVQCSVIACDEVRVSLSPICRSAGRLLSIKNRSSLSEQSP
jgi:hypothetical protein